MHIAEVKYFNTCAYETFFIKRYNFIIRNYFTHFSIHSKNIVRNKLVIEYVIYEWLKANPFKRIKVFIQSLHLLNAILSVKLCNKYNVESCYRLDLVMSILYLIIYKSINNNILINRSKLRNLRLDIYVWNYNMNVE